MGADKTPTNGATSEAGADSQPETPASGAADPFAPHTSPLEPVPAVPQLVIDEDAFCGQYQQTAREFLRTGQAKEALELVKMNSEEYNALACLKKALHADGSGAGSGDGLFTGGASEQLALTEEMLRRNPKSYNIWFHRRYLSQQPAGIFADQQAAASGDLEFIKEVFRRDNRNFHCWAYLGRLYHYPVALVAEQLSRNIANYSAYSALIQTGRAEELKEAVLKNYVFTDPTIAAPWVFLAAKLEQQRFGNHNAYLKVSASKMAVTLRTPRPTEVEVEVADRPAPIRYSANNKKYVPISFEQDGYQFADVKKLTVRSEGFAPVEIRIFATAQEAPPLFLAEFQQRTKHLNIDCLLLQLEYLKGAEREAVLNRLLQEDANRSSIYLDLAEEYRVFTG